MKLKIKQDNRIKETSSFGKKNYNLIVDFYRFFKNLNIHNLQNVINLCKEMKKEVKGSYTYKYFFNVVGKNIVVIDYLFNILLFIKKCYQI